MTEVAKSNGGGKTTRLMITKMVLENFKSYAGVQNIGPFHKRFSSVVGPNGSGKSNVIDALLFVFGKRAKQLRLNKVSELIHKSSAFPNLEYANVEVHFQLINDDEKDEDGYEVVPGSQFEVSRTAFQNNTSKYSIGSKTSNFNEVGVLLRSHGIDLDNNRFLILQGEVEQIAMMKPKGTNGPTGPSEDGLLEYLEDIIGSNKYVEQIEQWSKTLDELNERRIEKVNRMKIAERDRDNLSGSRAEAEEFLEKEREIRRKQNTLCQLVVFEANHLIEEDTKKRSVMQERLTAEKKKRVDNDRQLVESEKEYELTRAKYDRICDELSKATADFSAYERRDLKLTEDKKHTATQIKKLEGTITKENKKEADSQRDMERADKEVAALKVKIGALEAEKAAEEVKLQEIMDTLSESTSSIRETVEAKQIELGKAESIVAAIQTEKETTTTAISLVQKRVDSNKAQYEVCNNRIYQIQSELKDRIAQTAAIAQKKTATTERIGAVEKEIAVNVAKEPVMQQNLQSAIMQCEEGKLMMQNSRAGRSSIIDNVLKASKKGGPLSNAGVRGRLGDLATIAPEYDVAISTACGMLDHLVVETVEGGQAVLQYIRDAKLGRMSLIVLNQMDAHRRNMERPFTAPAGSARLFDLINISSPDLKPAFFCAMANTLVTNTLDHAVKLAYVGDKVVHRIVAQDGNLIDASGAMSGGGKTARSGAMRLSSGAGAVAAGKRSADEDISPQRLAQLEAAVKSMQEQLTAHRQQRSALEKELKECRQLLKQLDIDAEKAKMMMTRLQEQEVENNERLTECMGGMTMDAAEEAEVKKLQQQVVQLDAKISQTSPNLASLKAEVAALQQQILDVGGPKLKRTQLRISEYSAQLDEMSTTLSSKEVEISNCKKAVTQATKAIAKAQNELEKQQEKMAGLVQEQKEMEDDALKLIEAVGNAEKVKVTQEETLHAAKKAYDELSEAVNSMRTAEVDMETQCATLTKAIKENTATKVHWEKVLKTVRSKHMEEKSEMRSLLRSFQLTGAKKNMEIIAPSSSSAAASAASGSSEMDLEDSGNDENDGAAEDEIDDSDIPLLTMQQIAERFGASTEHPEVTAKILEKIKSARDEAKDDIRTLEGECEKLKSNVNMGALMEYLRKDADYRLRLVDLEAITTERNAARKSYEDCRRKRLEDFMLGFGVITLKLKEMYQMITLGGDAELELVDSLDPFAEGIVFSVRPPKKSWKNISNLSGGEKTLSSLALVFALHHYKPTPLYVMDEIDAALDFKNVSIVANYIKERTKNAQFIIISLRNNMFELADRLVGIYKTYDCTKSVTINPKLFGNCGDVEVNDGGANNTGSVNDIMGGKTAGKAAATATSTTAVSSVLANSTNKRL